VLGPVELALDAAAQRGHWPRYGADGSFPLGDFDLHFEVALRHGKDAPRWGEVSGTTPDDPILDRYVRNDPGRMTPAVVAGAEWSWKYSDEDTLTIGAEYYFDDDGYGSADIYPFLVAAPYLTGDPRPAFTPFYLARQYAGAYLYLPKPGSWNDTSFTLTAIASLTDGSAVIRLDHSVVINTYLKLETFLAGHAGHQGGEFRFGGTVPPQNLGGGAYTPAITIPIPAVDAGVALRLAL